MKHAMCIGAMTVVLYLFGAFCAWSADPGGWSAESRLWIALFWVACVFAISLDALTVAELFPPKD